MTLHRYGRSVGNVQEAQVEVVVHCPGSFKPHEVRPFGSVFFVQGYGQAEQVVVVCMGEISALG